MNVSSLILILRIATIIFVVEAGIMLTSSFLPPALYELITKSDLVSAMLDAVILVLISSPLIYLWVIRPNVVARASADAGPRLNEGRLNEAQRIARVGSWELTLESGLLTWSDEIYRIFEIDPSRFGATYEAFLDAIHPDDREKVDAAYSGSLADRSAYEITHRLKMPDGRIKWVSEHCETEFDADGSPLVSRGTVQDISDLKQAEQALVESENRLQTVLNSTPFVVYLKDLDGRYLVVNKRYQEILGKTEDEMIGHEVREFYSNEIAEQLLKGDQEAIESREPFSFELIVPGSEKMPGIRRVIKFPVIDSAGEVRAVGGMALDITELVRAEEQLRQVQKMEAVGQLTGGIAHEFNNLLMVIVGNLELYMHRTPGTPDRKLLLSAFGGAMRGGELTKQLLAFSRKQDLVSEAVDVNALVHDMHEMLQKVLGETVSIGVGLSRDIWMAQADRGQLESAVLNLALNARDAMPKGGEITISISNQIVTAGQLVKHPDVTPGDYVMLEVSDTGSGISPDVIEHVFEPFFSTKDVGKGTGLGLSMILGFAEQSGGFIDLESEFGHGTRVCLYLPRSLDNPKSAENHEPDERQPVPRNITVLVVEDDPDVRQIVSDVLSDLGFRLIEAEDGKSALAHLNANPDIDVLFTDVVLPGAMSGPDIATAAREIVPTIKIIFTSGYPDGEIDDLAPDIDQPWFIRKPYRKADLAELFDTVIQS